MGLKFFMRDFGEMKIKFGGIAGFELPAICGLSM